ncbi:uncharacterized protein LOC128212294 [Mya arenaria]|uniref:uncharacterized protein LOC128212294 n=1 Tax=Mya arenaria TaxID=6604 RepID=UPI0022DFA1E0|nr:uncharacterized protein LOC128212294 [Mya arenaria]
MGFPNDLISTEHQLRKRTKHLKSLCFAELNKVGIPFNETFEPIHVGVFRDEKYKLMSFLVAKIGSTFLKQMHQIVHNGSQVADSVFGLSRESVHINISNQPKLLNINNIQDYTVMIFSRNPYARLFSFYIDKIYMPNAYHVFIEEIQNFYPGKKCFLDTTFSDFIKFVIGFSGNPPLYDHFCPSSNWITYVPLICHANDLYIIKQETFSRDVDHVLRSIDIESKTYNTIRGALFDNKADIYLPGLIESFYETTLKRLVRQYPCVNAEKLPLRLWSALQIQGYIPKRCGFPMDKFNPKSLLGDKNFMLKLVMATVRENPMSEDERRSQRTAALHEAFDSIDEQAKEKLVNMYRMDFTLFDYDTNIP